MTLLWNILIAAGTLILVAILGFTAWYRWMTRARRQRDAGYDYIMVIDDCSAREVTSNEREYLETKFSPADGARPYIKFRYESVDGWGSIAGFLLRRQLPVEIPIRKPTDEEELSLGG